MTRRALPIRRWWVLFGPADDLVQPAFRGSVSGVGSGGADVALGGGHRFVTQQVHQVLGSALSALVGRVRCWWWCSCGPRWGGMVIRVVRQLFLCEPRSYRCRRTGPARNGGAATSAAAVLVVRKVMGISTLPIGGRSTGVGRGGRWGGGGRVAGCDRRG